MNFAWYQSFEDANDSVQSGYFTDLLGTSGQSIYVRKKSQDYAVVQPALYAFDDDNGFKINGQPLVITRYAEVRLNFAEAACGVGKLDEAWGTGTAAVVSPISHLSYAGKTYTVGDCGIGKITQQLYDTLTGIQWGKIEDTHGWIVPVD